MSKGPLDSGGPTMQKGLSQNFLLSILPLSGHHCSQPAPSIPILTAHRYPGREGLIFSFTDWGILISLEDPLLLNVISYLG